MGVGDAVRQAGQNRLLAAFPDEIWAELKGDLELVEHTAEQVLGELDKPASDIFFPLTGTLISICVTLKLAGRVEAATIGAEGMVGGLVTACDYAAFASSVVQLPGQSARIPAQKFGNVLESSSKLRDIIARYADALLAQLLQSVVCNAVHSMDQRLAGRLLITQDRVAADELPLTQENLARMLGVHRATVIRIVRPLRDAGIIEYGRGRLKILSRPKLERASCECYDAVCRHYDRVLPRGEAAREMPLRLR